MGSNKVEVMKLLTKTSISTKIIISKLMMAY